MSSLIPALWAFLVAVLTSHLLVPAVSRFALRWRAVDLPGGRKRHHGPLPRLGGIAIAMGIAVGIVGGYLAWNGKTAIEGSRDWGTLAIAGVVILILGVFDDLKPVSVRTKLIAQFLAAGLVVSLGWSFDLLRLPAIGPIDLGVAAPVLTMIWIVAVTNAINLLDGLDGLAGGVVAIISLSLMVFALIQGEMIRALVTSAMAGACIGFLRYNWRPARIFMGDSGSQTLGFALGVISVHSSLKSPTLVAIMVPLLALGLPVFDAFLVMIVRYLERPEDPLVARLSRMFRADRLHLHHLLESFDPRWSRIVAVIYGLVLVSCLMALAVAILGNFWIGMVLLGLEFAVVLGIRLIGLRRLAQESLDPKKRKVIEELSH